MITLLMGSKIAEKVAAKYQRLCPWISPRDLAQEAWVGMLSAKNFDASVGNLENYFYKAAANHSLKFILRFKFPISSYKFLKLEFTEPITLPCQESSLENMFIYREACEIMYNHIRGSGVPENEAKYAMSIIAGLCKSKEAARALKKDIRTIYRLVEHTKNLIHMEHYRNEKDNNEKDNKKEQTKRRIRVC